MAKLVPLGIHVVVKPVEEKAAENAAGFILPDKENEKPQRGEILAVGPGSKDEPMEVAVGDVVIFKKYAPDDFEIDGEKVLVLRQSDILAKVA